MSDETSGSPEPSLVEAPVVRSPDDPVAAGLRGFGPLGIFAILVIFAGNFLFVPLSAILVLAWVARSNTPWRDIGYLRPKSWTGAIMVGIAFGIAFKLLMKSIVMPLLGADPINHAYHHLVGNTAALPAMLYLIIIGAGFGEETLYRGFLFERLGKLFGHAVWSKASIVVLTSALFGLAHYHDQGLFGAAQAAIVGLVFGTIFMVTGRIAMLMFAHAAFDLTALAIIFWDLEYEVAHFMMGST